MSYRITLMCALFFMALFFNPRIGEAATKIWLGGTSTDWATASNWSPVGVPALADDIHIAVGSVFTNQPIISSGSYQCATLTFGVLGNITLTVNGTLAVTGLILQNPNTVLGNHSITLAGTGTLSGGSMQTGLSSVFVSVGTANSLQLISTISNLEIAGNVSIYSTTYYVLFIGLGYNNASFSIPGGKLTVGGQILTANAIDGILPIGTAIASATFSLDIPTGSVLNPTVKFTNATPINTLSITGSIDFYNNTGGTGTATVEYAGPTAQTVYSSSFAPLNHSPSTYQNIGYSGISTKTIQSGDLLIRGNWTSASGKVDVITNNPSVYFEGTTQTLTDAGSDGGIGVVFKNVNFRGGGTKAISSGAFSVSADGILTMAGSSTLSAGGYLTLISSASGSASVASIPVGSAINGNVNAQRFFKGSNTNLSKRGYRLISSPIYTATVATPTASNVFDLNYLLNNTYVSGLSGGGFNSPGGTNPSVFLYREDITPTTFTGFTTGNFKGIAKMNNTNTYDLGTQKRLTTTYINDTTVNIPAGNGLFVFYRGDKTNNATQTGTKVTLPFDYPEDAVFTQTGILNTGTVNVRLWHKSNNNLAYSTVSSPAPGNAAVKGFCLVGNPYACTINWEKFNRNGTLANSSIYGGGFPGAFFTQSTIWVFNPTTKQYNTYQQKSGFFSTADTTTNINPGLATGSASNMIASGQGFFIRATSATQTLSFREGAKVTTQPTAANLNLLMSLPQQVNTETETPMSILRLKLIKDSISNDDVVLAFNKDAIDNYSSQEDAEDLGGIGALVSLSTLSADSVKLSINRMQLPKSGQLSIPVIANATTTGIYQLSMTEIRNLPYYYEVWLMDNFKGDSLDIKNNNNYKFNLYRDNPATFANDRFKIVIKFNHSLAAQSLNFNAVKAGKAAQLSWKTNNNLTYKSFDVEKSTDGSNFTLLKSVNRTDVNSYMVTDNNPATGNNYYRLKAEPAVGISDITEQVMVYYPGESNVTKPVDKGFSVYPNPASDNVNLVINNPAPTEYIISLISTSGAIMQTVNSSNPTHRFNTSQLIPGTYIIQAVDSKTKKLAGRAKFIKQ
ncbi:MAG: T9SS type A sorting domain-containing protein [Sphingobacteriales bacterium]|nr:MAG: T9SS type A sorting domain-containing protein [Sphingobacteriales bacterium]